MDGQTIPSELSPGIAKATRSIIKYTVVLFMMARPKDRDFLILDMMASAKHRELTVEDFLISIPLFKF